MNTYTTNRLDYLDAVRAFALLLGIVFHASLSFMPVFIGWAVMDISTSTFVGIFAHISHAFRMELFFLIAGFFSHMTFYKKGLRNFLYSRFFRIVIPLVIGWIILRPLIMSGWIMGSESMRGEVDILNAFVAGLHSLIDTPATLFFTGTHLWFLYYLALITAGILLFKTLSGFSNALHTALSSLADKTVTWISCSRFGILVLILPTAACLWFMEHWGMDTPDKSLIPHIPVSLIYGGFFLFGWLLNRHNNLISQFSRITWEKVVLCVVSIVASTILNRYSAEVGSAHYVLLKTVFVISYAAMMWTLVALSIGLFKRFLDRPNAIIRYIADASYWLYLIHLPIVVWLQILFAELALHWAIKLVAISGITILSSILIYDLLVRPSVIGAILNGRKKERMIFKSRKYLPLDGNSHHKQQSF